MSYDHELLPSKKPKFLAQTAAHVSGAAFYYQQSDVTEHSWAKKVTFIYHESKMSSVVFAFLSLQLSFVFLPVLENVRSVCTSQVWRLVCHQSIAGV